MSEQGTVITFYSYKGGTGRTMALANIACLLSRDLEKSSGRVLMVDFDLEAPGLHHFFTKVSEKVDDLSPGIINYLSFLKQRFDGDKKLYKDTVKEGCKILEKSAPMDDYIISDILPKLDLIKAGSFDDEYPNLINSFDWQEFYSRYGDSITAFRQYLESRYRYILVDSRTGLTDISGICTMLLPEKLVGVFTPNRQNLQGLLQLIRQAVEYRQASDDFRPLAVFPLPSRVDQDEPIRRLEWRKKYQHEFQTLFEKIYEMEHCNLGEYFDEVMLQHVKYYAYGEEIAILTEPADSVSLSRSYRNFFERLISYDFAWQGSEKQKDEPMVFIGYGREDSEMARKLSQDLRNAGADPWLDQESVLPGQKWGKAAMDAIRKSDFFLLLLSEHLPKKGYFQQEIKMAMNFLDEKPPNEIFIIPVLLDRNAEVPESLADIQFVDLSHSYEEGLQQILKAVLSSKRGQRIANSS